MIHTFKYGAFTGQPGDAHFPARLGPARGKVMMDKEDPEYYESDVFQRSDLGEFRPGMQMIIHGAVC